MTNTCKKCGYLTSHPFGISFKNSICSGCITHQEKYDHNWSNRYDNLIEIIKSYSSSNKYDCVVPIIGDAEDYFTVYNVLKLDLNPLLVSVNSYFLNDIGWKNLHNLTTFFDLDSIVYNPDLITYKELIKTSLRKYKHMLLPFIQLHTSFPVHIAKERNIPLVIWGGNQSVEQVGKFSHDDRVEMSKWSRKEHDLFNVDIKTLIGNGAQVNERHLNYYYYPPISKLAKKVRGIYLSNYIAWDPLKQNNSMIKYGFSPESNNVSFDIYERSGSSVYYAIHDLLKYERNGYRKLNDHVSREIRHSRISTSEGKFIIKEKINEKVYIKPFFDWLGTTKSGYVWFKEHMLKKSQNLISEEPISYNFDRNILPKKILDLLIKSKKSDQNFILFGKGIDI